MFAIGVFDRPLTGNVSANVTSVAHNQLARDLAGRTTVLLKNDESLLPLDSGSLKSIAVVGSAAHDAVISGELALLWQFTFFLSEPCAVVS